MMQAIRVTYDEGHEGEPHTPAPETTTPQSTPAQQEEGTPQAALVPLEEEVIEGEVIAIIEPTPKPTPKHPPYYLIVVVTIAGCLLFTLASFLLPLLSPTATVTILPVERSLSIITAIQVHGRQLPPLTLSQSITVSATGKRHQDATQAYGTITFYNGLLSSQTIAAGTVLTGRDGVQIITDQAARIPPASNTTPPTFGQVTVEAHAVQPGAKGNIPPYDINGSCCAPSILVKNTSAFTGGQSVRDYTVVTEGDMTNTVTSLKTTLLKSDQAALHAQITSGEALISPPCRQTTTADHRIGEEAKEATITVSETCSSIAYDAHFVAANATQMITKIALQRFGTNYTLLGDVTESVVHATISDQKRGIATLTVKIDATSIYQLSQAQKRQLMNKIAGKSKTTALHILLSLPGIQGVQITVKGGNQTLPQDPTAIHILVLYRAM